MEADPQRSAKDGSQAGDAPLRRSPGTRNRRAPAADAPPPGGRARRAPPADDPVPRWLRSGAAIAWRLLVLAAAIAVSAYALAYLRIVVLPVIVALLLSTVLGPPARWLTRHRFSDGAAAGTVLLGALAALGVALTMAGAAVGRQFSDLADSVQDGIREAGDALSEPPFNLSQATSTATSTTPAISSATPAAR